MVEFSKQDAIEELQALQKQTELDLRKAPSRRLKDYYAGMKLRTEEALEIVEKIEAMKNG